MGIAADPDNETICLRFISSGIDTQPVGRQPCKLQRSVIQLKMSNSANSKWAMFSNVFNVSILCFPLRILYHNTLLYTKKTCWLLTMQINCCIVILVSYVCTHVHI